MNNPHVDAILAAWGGAICAVIGNKWSAVSFAIIATVRFLVWP